MGDMSLAIGCGAQSVRMALSLAGSILPPEAAEPRLAVLVQGLRENMGMRPDTAKTSISTVSTQAGAGMAQDGTLSRPRTSQSGLDVFAKDGKAGAIDIAEGSGHGADAVRIEDAGAVSPVKPAGGASGGDGGGAEARSPIRSPLKSPNKLAVAPGSPLRGAGGGKQEGSRPATAHWPDLPRAEGAATKGRGVPPALTAAGSEGWLKVRILTLYNNSIADAGCIVLAKALGKASTITSLSLRCNRVADLGLQAIALSLAHNQTLLVLDLSMNEIGDAGTHGLAEALGAPVAGKKEARGGSGKERSRPGTSNPVQGGGSSSGGGGVVLPAIKGSRPGTGAMEGVGKEGSSRASTPALDPSAQLASAGAASERVSTAASGGGKSQRVRTAGSGGSGGGRESRGSERRGARDDEALGAGVSNRSITSIDLDRNSVSNDGASALAAALRSNVTLTSLSLTHNRLGDSGVKELEHVMALCNTSLLRLTTAGNPAHPALVRRLEAAVQDNVKVPHSIHYRFACVYRYRQRCRRNRPSLGGTPPFEWTITPGLPAGLAFDHETGEISGVPQVCQQRSRFTVTATNVAGTSSAHIMLQVDPGVVLKVLDAKGNYSRAHTQGGSEEAARYKVAFQYADSAKRRCLDKQVSSCPLPLLLLFLLLLLLLFRLCACLRESCSPSSVGMLMVCCGRPALARRGRSRRWRRCGCVPMTLTSSSICLTSSSMSGAILSLIVS